MGAGASAEGGVRTAFDEVGEDDFESAIDANFIQGVKGAASTRRQQEQQQGQGQQQQQQQQQGGQEQAQQQSQQLSAQQQQQQLQSHRRQPSSWKPGTKWRKCQRLGRGTFGIVYKALDVRTRRFFAVKEISLEHAFEGDEDKIRKHLEDIKKELTTHKDLHHENIVHFYGAQTDTKQGEIPRKVYIVSTEVEGREGRQKRMERGEREKDRPDEADAAERRESELPRERRGGKAERNERRERRESGEEGEGRVGRGELRRKVEEERKRTAGRGPQGDERQEGKKRVAKAERE